MSELLWGRYCKVCNIHYTELKSLGKWQCTYHPLPLNTMGRSIEEKITNGKDKYGNITTDKYPAGCFECCGASPIAILPSARRNPYFDSTKLKGCVRKDHSGIQGVFTDHDDIPMSSWPENLRAEIDEDIQLLLNNPREIVGDMELMIQHKGLYVREDGEICIRRYDKEEEIKVKKENLERN